MKYLLTTGSYTNKVEKYILDLFKLYFEIQPDGIPNSSIGFNKVLTSVTKEDLKDEVSRRVKSLISNFQNKFNSVKISFDDLEMIDESTFKLKISVNTETEYYEINSGLY